MKRNSNIYKTNTITPNTCIIITSYFQTIVFEEYKVNKTTILSLDLSLNCAILTLILSFHFGINCTSISLSVLIFKPLIRVAKTNFAKNAHLTLI